MVANFQVLYTTSSKQVANIDKRILLIKKYTIYTFSAVIKRKNENDYYRVGLVGINADDLEFQAVKDGDGATTVTNTGKLPIMFFDFRNQITNFTSYKIPKFGRLILFVIGVDPSSELPRMYKIIFDSDGTNTKVTLE